MSIDAALEFTDKTCRSDSLAGILAAEVRCLRKDNHELSRNIRESEITTQMIRDKLSGFMRAYRADVKKLREENERLRKDAERLDWIANEYAHIEPFGIPTGEGDSETGWKVSQEQCGQIKPKQLSVVYKDSLRESIDAARGAK